MADAVWQYTAKSAPPGVAAVAAASASQDEIAGVAKFSRKNRRRQGGQGGQGGQGQREGAQPEKAEKPQEGRGKRHSDGPPPSACNMHWKWGKNAHYCSAKTSCPWVNDVKPPQDKAK